MARKPRPHKRCKKSKARRLVIKRKLEEKQFQLDSAVVYKDETSESVFNRILEEQR